LHGFNFKKVVQVLFKYIWNEITIYLTCDSDWRLAKKIMKDIADNWTEKLSKNARQEIKYVSKEFMIYYNKLTPIVYMNMGLNGLELTLRYLCEPRKKRISTQNILEDILDEFCKFETIKFKNL
jgi:small-conductance mechanosensitive channel